jgi:hypothetical protein
LLLQDLPDKNGKIRRGTPDLKSEAGVAFRKIMAVYGRVDKLEILSLETSVTKWLGQVRTISESEVRSGPLISQR